MLPERRFLAIFVILAAVVGFSCWKIGRIPPRMRAITVAPAGIMGTDCTLTLYVKEADAEHARALLAEAENELRRCEALTSTWLENSEVSRFNQARAGEKIPLSPFTEAFFRRSREAYEETGGAFDITCGRVWNLWKTAAETGVMPTEAEIQAAREASCWEYIRLENGAVTKTVDTVRVVTGGIAKGMAADRALQHMRRDRVLAAVVEVGGDLSFFCTPEMKIPIMLRIKSPCQGVPAEELPLSGSGGVCTSGDYARFFEINGKKYAQIIDPRTGWPTENVTAVTVSAADTATADIWATAVSVLGENGRDSLPTSTKILKYSPSHPE